MKYYLFALLFIVSSIAAILVTPNVTQSAQITLTSIQIPRTQSVIGIQKINAPPVSKNLSSPSLTARSVLVKDLATDTILYQKDANYPVPIASTTKIMTALIGSEYFQPNSILTVSSGDSGVIGAKVGFMTGEKLSFRSLLYAMLLNSGNDAAYTIADNYTGGINGFVEKMNQKAKDLNLRNTHFENPAGYDDPSHYSSAADLAIITQEALKDSQLVRIFATKETEILSLDKRHTHKLNNLNQLLSSVNGVLGVKTGYTELAKENLVTLVERDNHKILTIVLGSDDRFGESTKLIEWVYYNFTWQDQDIH